MSKRLAKTDKPVLTPKQRRFCEEYLIDLNATQAAIRAGYSKKTAKEQGCQNLTKLNIKEQLQAQMAARSKRTEVRADGVLQGIARLAFANIGDYVEFGPEGVKLKPSAKISRGQMDAVAEVSETVTKDGGTRRFKLHDKTKNLELLGRHLGLFVDRHEQTGGEGEPITINVIKHYVKSSNG